MELLHIRPTHGELFTISVAALDQLNNAVFSTVWANYQKIQVRLLGWVP